MSAQEKSAITFTNLLWRYASFIEDYLVWVKLSLLGKFVEFVHVII